MEIRRALQGRDVSFSPAVKAGQSAGKTQKAARTPATDRLVLSQWVAQVDEQRAQAERQFYMSSDVEPKDQGIWSALDSQSQQDASELDMMAKELDAQLKCAEIAARIMAGKKVPMKDEHFLMESDPAIYKLALALRKRVPDPDEKECESVLDDEDKQSGQSGGEAGPVTAAAPAEGGGESALA